MRRPFDGVAVDIIQVKMASSARLVCASSY